MPDSPYALVEPFDVDNGELDGLTLVDAFVFGVEWQQFRTEIQGVSGFSKTVHKANSERLAKMCSRRGRKYRVTYLDDLWAEIQVADLVDVELDS